MRVVELHPVARSCRELQGAARLFSHLLLTGFGGNRGAGSVERGAESVKGEKGPKGPIGRMGPRAEDGGERGQRSED